MMVYHNTQSTSAANEFAWGETINKIVGVIGLGAVGLGIARSLLRAGFNVHACDVREAVTQQFVGEGGVACASPA